MCVCVFSWVERECTSKDACLCGDNETSVLCWLLPWDVLLALCGVGKQADGMLERKLKFMFQLK